MTVVVLAGLFAHRREKREGRFTWESLALIVLYAAASVLVFTLASNLSRRTGGQLACWSVHAELVELALGLDRRGEDQLSLLVELADVERAHVAEAGLQRSQQVEGAVRL